MIKDSHVRTLRRVAFHRRRIIQSTHSSLFSLLIYSYHTKPKVNQTASESLTLACTCMPCRASFYDVQRRRRCRTRLNCDPRMTKRSKWMKTSPCTYRSTRRKTTTTHMNSFIDSFIHSLLPTDERVCCFTFNRATIVACLKRFDPSLKVRARVDIKYRDGFGKGKQTSS